MTGQEIIDAQVSAGVCERGTCPNCCKLGGIEANCDTIRECRPDLHFEYSQPESSPNINMWVWNGTKMVWNGPAPVPTFAPTLGTDPFGGGYIPTVDYTQMYTGGFPTTPVSGGPRGGQTPVNQVSALTGSGADSAGASAGPSTAPAFTPGLETELANYFRSVYGSTAVTQQQFCRAYASKTGFPCDFIKADSSTRDVSAWMTMLRSDQDARVGVIGVAGQFGTGGTVGSGVQVPTVGSTSTPGTNFNPDLGGGGGGLFSGGIMSLLLVGAIVYFATK